MTHVDLNRTRDYSPERRVGGCLVSFGTMSDLSPGWEELFCHPYSPRVTLTAHWWKTPDRATATQALQLTKGLSDWEVSK